MATDRFGGWDTDSVHGIWCNIVYDSCRECGKWVSYCLTHREPTRNNRCQCDAAMRAEDADE